MVRWEQGLAWEMKSTDKPQIWAKQRIHHLPISGAKNTVFPSLPFTLCPSFRWRSFKRIDITKWGEALSTASSLWLRRRVQWDLGSERRPDAESKLLISFPEASLAYHNIQLLCPVMRTLLSPFPVKLSRTVANQNKIAWFAIKTKWHIIILSSFHMSNE